MNALYIKLTVTLDTVSERLGSYVCRNPKAELAKTYAQRNLCSALKAVRAAEQCERAMVTENIREAGKR